MPSDGGAVMFLRGEAPVDGSTQCFLLYMYAPNLVQLREQLLSSGIAIPQSGFQATCQAVRLDFAIQMDTRC
jgi:hypothetical protein